MNDGWKEKMTKFVIDAYAWIEYLDGSEKGKKVTGVVENNLNEIFTSSATIAEIVSKFLRKNKDSKLALDSITSLSHIINITQEISISAGQIHFLVRNKNKDFGMLDAFVAATANKIKAKILTGDEDFRFFKEAVFI